MLDLYAEVSVLIHPAPLLVRDRRAGRSRQRHEFEWLFAIAPIDMTQALIDQFGLTVVNAPRAPVILIDADGNARLLPNGVKTAEELLEEIGELPESPAEDGENS